ncbi:MAG: 3-(3-hydroxy-phenyl)propionate hydroxylase [Mycobacterium sp.]|nr:3-(3-hydroxy-phenyl)propionate hydroxylase [Mycobacterium sp.]
MTSSETYDVAVIGYGPTGATAANLLGQLGLRVVVVERDSDIYNRARAVSTDEEVMRIWQSVGLADRLQQDMLPDRPLTFVDHHGAPFIDVKVSPRGAGHPPQQFLYQPAVEQVLRDGVERFTKVDVLLQHECLRLHTEDDRVELMVADLRTDTLKRLHARYVVAADGGSSPTRGQLGIGYTGRTYSERWVVIDTKVRDEWEGHDRLRFHCNPDRPTVDCPTPLSHHRWEYPARTGEVEQELLRHDAIWEVLNDQGITDANVEILRAVIYSHHVRVADRWRVGRVFLAGDAAHAMPPYIGQGMSAGVRDAANLCWKLAAVVQEQSPESLLDTYQAERKPHVTEVTRRACRTGRLITERRRAVAAMRNHLLRNILRVPAVSGVVDKFAWIPAARYRRGFLSSVRHPAVGWQVPQPWVRNADGARVRFDEVLGRQWAVVHTGSAPPGIHAWSRLGVPTIPIAEPTLVGWLRRKKAAAAVLRPDGFIYAAAKSGQPLPPPPEGYAVSASARTEASA